MNKHVSQWMTSHALLSVVMLVSLLGFLALTVLGLQQRQDNRSKAATLAATQSVQAKMADSFIDSIGVNTHTYYGEYGNYGWKDKLVGSGIRHIRENLQVNNATQIQRVNDLHTAGGIKISFIADLRSGRGGTVDQMTGRIKSSFLNATAQVEGPNEYENGGEFNASLGRAYQKELYTKVKNDPALKHLPVLGPSAAHAKGFSSWGDLSASLDYGNIHSYPGGRMSSANLQEWMTSARTTSGAKPLQATETGYHNAVGQTSGHLPASEKAAGIYLPRLYFDYFNNGIVRTYTYELLDEAGKSAQESSFGLLRKDFREKPTMIAIKNLISLLKDPGPSFTPASLSYDIANAPADLRKTLLQKRNGTFYLAVWREVSVYNQTGSTDIDPANQSVTLQLQTNAASIKTFMPNRSTTPIAQVANVSQLTFETSEEVTIIEITGIGQPGSISLVPPSSVPSPSKPFGVSTPPFFGVGPCPPNKFCPSTVPSVVVSGAQPNPSGSHVSPSSGITNPNPVEPCVTSASLATAKKEKSKHKQHNGGISGFMEALIRFFLELLNLFLRLFGGGQVPIPTPTPEPYPSPEPCEPSAVPSQPLPSSTEPSPSTAQPSTVAPSITLPSVVPSQAVPNPSSGLITGQVLWRGDPDAGRNQWSKEHVANPSRITIETIGERKAWKMQLNDGDRFSGERVEFGQDNNTSRDFNNGDEVWLGHSFYMPSDFPTNVKWTVLTQWKDQDPDGGSPSWGTYVQNDKIEIGGQLANKLFATPATKNVWHNIVWHMKLSETNNGLVEIYYSSGNMVPVKVASKIQKTYRPPSAKMVPRMGYYRDPSIATNNAVYHAGWTVGTSFEAVNPVK